LKNGDNNISFGYWKSFICLLKLPDIITAEAKLYSAIKTLPSGKRIPPENAEVPGKVSGGVVTVSVTGSYILAEMELYGTQNTLPSGKRTPPTNPLVPIWKVWSGVYTE
jgi:hypothetical protein